MTIPTKLFSTYSKFDLLTAMDRAERFGDKQLLEELENYARWRGIKWGKIEHIETESEYWYCEDCGRYHGEECIQFYCGWCHGVLVHSTMDYEEII